VPKNFSVVLALIGVQDPRRIPVLVGVGQLRSNRERTVAGAREPAELMLDALQLAAVDAGSARLLTEADSIDAVNTVSWSYEDLPGLLAARPVSALRCGISTTAPSAGSGPLGCSTPRRLGCGQRRNADRARRRR